jgi:hypothetical protein
MKNLLVVSSLFLSMVSCGSLPEPAVVDDYDQTRCSRPYIDGTWRFVHAIQAEMRPGKKGFFMGVTRISPEKKSIRCVMMTIEGFVLLDATTAKNALTIHRGVSPFDSRHFVQGLMEDIKLAFFKPPGQPLKAGTFEDGLFVCRYKSPDGRITDIVTGDNSAWEIRRYNKNKTLSRSIKASKPEKLSGQGGTWLPGRIEIKAHGMHEYLLTLDLIESELIAEQP